MPECTTRFNHCEERAVRCRQVISGEPLLQDEDLVNSIVLIVDDRVCACTLMPYVATDPSEERSWMLLVIEQVAFFEELFVDLQLQVTLQI